MDDILDEIESIVNSGTRLNLKYYIDDSLWAANVTHIAHTQRTVLARFAECGLYVTFAKCCLTRQPAGAPSPLPHASRAITHSSRAPHGASDRWRAPAPFCAADTSKRASGAPRRPEGPPATPRASGACSRRSGRWHARGRGAGRRHRHHRSHRAGVAARVAGGRVARARSGGAGRQASGGSNQAWGEAGDARRRRARGRWPRR